MSTASEVSLPPALVTETLRVLALIEVVGLAAVPLAGTVFARLPGAGLGFAKPLGLLLAAWLAWVAWSLGAPNGLGLAIASAVVIVLAGLLVALRVRARMSAGEPAPADASLRRSLWRWSEGLFAATFLGGALLSSYAPDVWGTEKPMDMMLVNAQLASEDFPPHDPWMSGMDLNYYYLGQYLIAWVIRLTGVEPTVGYNLAIALVFALAVSAAFTLTATLWAAARRDAPTPGRRAVAAGLAGALFTVLLGNLAAFKDLLDHDGPLTAFDWFGTTRVIPGTINEFPFFSWVLGDLHAHVIAVAFTFLGLAFALQWGLAGARGRPRGAAVLELAVMGIAIGSLYAINSWSYPVVLGIAILGLLGRSVNRRALLACAALVAVSVLAVLPHHLTFDRDIVRGIGSVTEQRSWTLFVRDIALTIGLQVFIVAALYVARVRATANPWRNAAWGLAIALFAGAALAGRDLVGVAFLAILTAVALWFGLAGERRGAERFTWLLVAGGFTCLLIPEVVYIRDGLDGTENYRMNTVFRFGYQAWLLLGVAAAVVLLRGSSLLPRRAVRAWRAAAVVLALASLAYPIAGTYARKGGFSDGPHLDGMRWLPAGDVAAIEWLSDQTPGDAVVLEATGDDYSAFGHARISVYTGRPTVMGWAGHEAQFGQEPGNRRGEVEAAYTDRNGAIARPFLQRYGVDYVVVGPLERADYGDAGVPKWDDLGRRVFERDGTIVWAITPPS
jgi:YYY domain-containing protein